LIPTNPYKWRYIKANYRTPTVVIPKAGIQRNVEAKNIYDEKQKNSIKVPILGKIILFQGLSGSPLSRG
jgi:hypothetical protein